MELFGCSGEISIRLPDYPNSTYLPGATYLEEEDRVLSCGGITCPSMLACQMRSECHYWSPDSGEWGEEGPPLLMPRSNFLMAQVFNFDAAGDPDGEVPVPLVLGSRVETEIFVPSTSNWTYYHPIEDDQWVGLGCLVQHEDLVYNVRYRVETLNTSEWTFGQIGEDLPDALVNPGRCAHTEIDGRQGIFTRYGYFFDLNATEWEKRAVPPYDSVARMPNEMFSFRGRPTVFGYPTCGSEGSCVNKDIVQYLAESDEWVKIGEMLETRTLHEVVTLPSSACENFVSGTTPQSSSTTASVTTEEPVVGESTLGQSAALIVGGVKSSVEPNTVISTVELFGCPDTARDSIEVADFPYPIYLTGSTLMPDESRVMACGGFGCDESVCFTMEECYYWSPEANVWEDGPSLTSSRSDFILALAPNIDEPDEDNSQFPLVLGNSLSTEILGQDGVWSEYRDVDDIWYSRYCLFQHDGLIYSLRDEIVELNPYTWNVTVLGTMPDTLNQRGRCTALEINGELGVMLPVGDWFSLRSFTWRKFAVPPLDPIGDVPNAMFSFGGRPTIFGIPSCDSDGECEYREVVQYDPLSDSWLTLGSMTETRLMHEVIEVPVEYCDYFVLEEESSEENEAAIILGGYNQATDVYHQSVELFGCTDDETIYLTDYPEEGIILTSGTFITEEGRLMVCGGSTCPPCVRQSLCYYWSPFSGEWTEAPSLVQTPSLSLFMAQMPNLLEQPPDDHHVPGILWFGTETEIFDSNDDQWVPYISLEESGWGELGCIHQEGDKIYHIWDEILILDLADWTVQSLGVPPDNIVRSGTCAYTEINGDPGIFTRYGYFFNLHTEAWEKKSFPSYDSVGVLPNSMWTFQGRPTIFGMPDCNEVGECSNNKIVQYIPKSDAWTEIGSMLESRTFHTMISIPGSYCQTLVGESSQKTAALVIGGNIPVGDDVEHLDSVELFGCEGSASDSIRLKDFPSNIYLHAGRYVQGEEKVMVCGGITCAEGGQCSQTNLCYHWNPEDDSWEEAPPLNSTRYNFIMPEVVHPDKPDGSPLAPLAIGTDYTTEIFDFDLNQWTPYETLQDRWYSLACLLEVNGSIYNVRMEITELDPASWTFNQDFPPLPENLETTGKCATVEVEGELGIFLQFGYWFGLESQEWKKLAISPFDPVTNDPNAMWTFRGRPTIFGQANCNDEGECSTKDVIQYNPDNNSWVFLGTLRDNRRSHEVIEIPGELCAYFDLGDGSDSYTETQTVSSVSDNLAVLEATSVGIRDEVAIIIAGYFPSDDDETDPILRSVELFGCTGTESIILEEYPDQAGYLMGAIYMEEEGRVLSCGGYSCLGVSTDCEAREDCHWWTPASPGGTWEAASSLALGKFNFLMASAPYINGSFDERTALAAGFGNTSEIYDRPADQWVPYLLMPENNWFALGCLTQHGNTIYSITETIVVLDVLNWEYQSLGEVPDGLYGQGRCGYVEVNESPGIFLRNGHWFDLTAETWHKVTLPPYDPVNPAGLTNALWAYEGKPTVFGDAVCDVTSTCENRNIVQYDQDTDQWTVIGQMSESRTYHEVAMLPKDVCSNFVDVSSTTTEKASEDTVALIIGGASAINSPEDAHQSVELFGCAEFGGNSVRLRDFPNPVYMAAGIYRSDIERALLCGGFGCDNLECVPKRECFYWPSASNGWYSGPTMIDPHDNNIMVMVPNLNKPESEPLEPVVIGNGYLTEILDTDTETWSSYMSVEDRNWYGNKCFLEFEDMIYSLRDRVDILDPSTWILDNEGESLPEGLARKGKCSGIRIEDEPGIFLAEGYWYNLNSTEWIKKAVPPVDPTESFPNAMWTFRGRPTIFGEPVCSDDASCENKGILQYLAETDTWEAIGTMLVPRSYHEVIEIPASFCDILVPREEDTTSSTMPTTTTSTSTTTTTTTITMTAVSTPSSTNSTTEEGGGGNGGGGGDDGANWRSSSWSTVVLSLFLSSLLL